jgi:hypothetical protein
LPAHDEITVTQDLKGKLMATSAGSSKPEVDYRERLTAPLHWLALVALCCVAFSLGPGQLNSVWVRGNDPAWVRMLVVGAGWGALMAVIVAVNNYLTVITINRQAIVCPGQTVHFDAIVNWTQLRGPELRRWVRHLASDQGGPYPIGVGIWALRGGRTKVFRPPWMPTGFLVERETGTPIVIGTRHPEAFLAALRAALGPGRAHDIESGKVARERLTPPEIKEAARRVVDDLMPRHSSNGQFHGHHRKQHERPPR